MTTDKDLKPVILNMNLDDFTSWLRGYLQWKSGDLHANVQREYWENYVRVTTFVPGSPSPNFNVKITGIKQIQVEPSLDVRSEAEDRFKAEKLDLYAQIVKALATDKATSRQKLASKIDEAFNIGELKWLCRELDVEYENLPGETRMEKSGELVDYMWRRGRLDDLIDHCRKLRPRLSW